MHAQGAPALSVDSLSLGYGGKPVLTNVSFDLPVATRLAIVGPNGAGKTTLLKALAGLTAPDMGSIQVHGHEPTGHICIAYVPQRSTVDWRFPVTVYDVVMMGRTSRLGPLRRPGTHDRQQVSAALTSVGLETIADRQIEELSGGQQQRMFIARALAQEAELVLMDEPFAGLDIQSRDEVLALLPSLGERDVTVVVALHDLGIASSRFDRVLLLKEGMIGYGPPGEVFTPSTLQRAYGSCLRIVESENGLLVVHDTGCTEEGHEPL